MSNEPPLQARRGNQRRLLVGTEPQRLTLRGATATAFEIIERERAPAGIELPRGVRFLTRGCLYDAAGRKVDASQRAGGAGGDRVMAADPAQLPGSDAPGSPLPPRSGRTLYLGTFMNHYGHFVTEFLSRLWDAEPAAGFDHVVAYPFSFSRGEVRLQRFHHYIAGLLGLPMERLEILRSAARFEEIVVPEQLWVINRSVNRRLRGLYARIRDRHAAAPASGRLFLSRGSGPESRIANMPEIEDVFSSFGFRVIFPEEHDIAEQLRLYANCEILAGASGSGMHNCLFARPGTPVIEVGDIRARNKPVRMQAMANRLAEVRPHFLPYDGGEDRRADAGKLVERLSGILGERPRRGGVGRRLARLVARARRSFRPRRPQ